MANPVCELLLTEAELERALEWPEGPAGAIVDFRGVVRAVEQDRTIRGIDYEAHPVMALHQLRMIAREAVQRFDLEIVVIRHRIGFVEAGKTSLLARVAASHRPAALKGLEWLVDELKKRVPIWKHPEFELDAVLQREVAQVMTK